MVHASQKTAWNCQLWEGLFMVLEMVRYPPLADESCGMLATSNKDSENESEGEDKTIQSCF
jgi:hypothetical protein